MNATSPMPPLPVDPDAGPRRGARWMVALAILFVVLALAWAAWAELDVAVQARGKVAPPSRLQEVQSLEGGIVQQMLVQAGQQVRRGDVLMRLDTAQYEADVGESRQRQLAALAGLARVDALLQGGEPRFDPALRAEAPALVDKEIQLWRDAAREHASALSAAAEGVSRRRSELAEAQARIESLTITVKVAEESFAIEERLFREGATSRADHLAAQQRLLAQRHELDALRSSLPRLRAGLAEAQAQASEVGARARAQWGGQRTQFQADASALDSTLGGRRDRVARREITSPVDGIVNRVLLPTQGGVAGPGKAILEIVPADADIELVARVNPADVGFIRPGQDAQVRVAAYDATIYGRLPATVSRVGADAVLDERGEPYIEVQLSTPKRALSYQGRELAVTPGMPVEIGIVTGQRTVMQYLLKPVLRGFQSALQER